VLAALGRTDLQNILRIEGALQERLAELNVIAAVVIGGASLMGGRGGVINTLLGALVMGIIANLMNLVGVPGYHQQVYMGLIIIVAMLLQYSTGSLKH